MIKVIHGDAWDFYGEGWDIAFPTTGYVNNDGEAVLARGIARTVKEWFGGFGYVLGEKIKKHGNHVFYFGRQRLFTFPTKDNWKENAKLELIEQSCKELKIMWDIIEKKENKKIKIVMPKVGCGWGKLKWEDVAPIIERHFGQLSHEKFLIVDNESGDTRQYKGKNPNSEKDNTEHKLFVD